MAAALAIVWLVVRPPVVDLAAAFYRASLFSTHGWQLWDNNWYGGNYLLGYSVLYPPLAALLGVRLLGALAVVATAATSERLIHNHYGRDGWLASCWLAVGIAGQLFSGRITFVLGLVGVAVCALALDWLLRERGTPGPTPGSVPQSRNAPASSGAGAGRRRGTHWRDTAISWLLMLAGALFSGLASPVAALFTAVVGAAVVIAGRPRRAAWPAGAAAVLIALVPVVALSVAFPQSGYEPFPPSTLWPVLVGGAVLIVALLADRRSPLAHRQQLLLAAAIIYLLGCVLTAMWQTAVGSNVARFGDMALGPVVALALYPQRRTRRWALAVLAIAAVPLGYVQIYDGISDSLHGVTVDHSKAAFYQPLVRYLRARPGASSGAFRVEIPFTIGHWESNYVARSLPLARGWERQRDIGVDPIFYDRGALTASSYRAWLDSLAVAYVAVPDVQPDYSARTELALIDRGLPYLKLIARLPHWRVYAVRKAMPLVGGAAELVRLERSSVALRFTRAGSANVRVRYSPYWELAGVRGCVSDADGFVRVRADGSGSARLRMAFAVGRVGAHSPRCN